MVVLSEFLSNLGVFFYMKLASCNFFSSKIPFIFDTFNTLKRGEKNSGEMSLNSVTSLQMYHDITEKFKQ